MDIDEIELGKTFVRYVPEKDRDQSYFGVVTGILGNEGEALTICLISRPGRLTVKRTECTLVLPTAIRSGLVGFRAHIPHFGAGVVEEEELEDNLLYVVIGNAEHRSGAHPITDVTFCCS